MLFPASSLSDFFHPVDQRLEEFSDLLTKRSPKGLLLFNASAHGITKEITALRFAVCMLLKRRLLLKNISVKDCSAIYFIWTYGPSAKGLRNTIKGLKRLG